MPVDSTVERYDWIRRKRIIEPLTWSYTWDGAGQLIGVKNNDKVNLRFEYDALGRRTAKINAYGKAEQHTITRFLWDGNVPLHEWVYPLSERPATVDDSEGRRTYLTPEPQTELTTWLFDEGTFVPSAKIVGERRYSIISDYLGTPVEAYDDVGKRVWKRELDIYGRVRIEQGEVGLVPFLYQGQYLDTETGLAFNRFRYYSPETGAYISQDPIRLAAGLSNLYAYVHDVNAWVDPWGLELIPNKVAGNAREALAKRWLQKKYPNAQILSERYIRDSSGVSVKDSFGSRRRLDFVVVEDGKVRGIFEVTSPTADKTLQIRKEQYIRNNGGTHIKAPGRNGVLYDISDVDTQRLDVDLESHKVSPH